MENPETSAKKPRKSAVLVAVLFSLLGFGLVMWRSPGSSSDPSAQQGSEPLAPGWQASGELFAYRGRTMGTTFAVSVRGVPATQLGPLALAMKQALDEVNGAMSTYDPQSEISRFNQGEVGHQQQISAAFAKVLGYSLGLAKRTEGAFDPTVGPLVRAWGFGAGAKPITQAPGRDQLDEILAEVGHAKVLFDPASRKLSKQAKVELDLSAVAKGFGVDKLVQVLETQGVEHLMVEIGGELCVRGRPAADRPWRIGVETPAQKAQSARVVLKMVELQDLCMATSGDYRNYLALNGEKRQHTIDPRSGDSVRNGLTSVSVMAKSAMQADALATAMMVLGPKAAQTLAKSEQVETMMILRVGEELDISYTQAFADKVLGEPAAPQ